MESNDKSMFEGKMSSGSVEWTPQGSVYQALQMAPSESSQRQRASEMAKKWCGVEGWAETEAEYGGGMGGSTLEPGRDVFFKP